MQKNTTQEQTTINELNQRVLTLITSQKDLLDSLETQRKNLTSKFLLLEKKDKDFQQQAEINS